MLSITQSILPGGNKCRPGTVAQKKYIVIHDTANKSAGAGAANHAAYLQNLARANTKYLSWHFTVDDKAIYQHLPANEVSWNAGDGEKGPGNVNGIAIEICVNPESDFGTAVHNAAQLTASLLKEYGLNMDAVKQHHDFSGKDCPHDIRAMGLWNVFLADVKSEYGATAAPAAPAAPSSGHPQAGDIVTVSGRGYATAAGTGAKTKVFANTQMKVLAYREGAAAPYQLTQIPDSNETTGFFPENAVQRVQSQAQAPKTPAPAVPATQSYVVTAAVSVNVRQSPGGKVIDWYMNGRRVEVCSIEDGWAKIIYGSGVAYIGASFLKKA